MGPSPFSSRKWCGSGLPVPLCRHMVPNHPGPRSFHRWIVRHRELLTVTVLVRVFLLPPYGVDGTGRLETKGRVRRVTGLGWSSDYRVIGSTTLDISSRRICVFLHLLFCTCPPNNTWRTNVGGKGLNITSGLRVTPP